MKVKSRSMPFGSATRTRVLVLLSLLGSSYARELARLLAQPVSVVQKALFGLERDALIAAQAVGRTRLFRLNPLYFARKELVAYLARLSDADDELLDIAATVRRRPRLTGKPL
jgi:DNA-binding transcriptional ArsR family regulator